MMQDLEVRNLHVHYPCEGGRLEAVSGVSFVLPAGKSLGIAGESACGKSTLGHSIIRMARGGTVGSGTITLGGRSLLSMTEDEFDKDYRWRRISMVFQGAMNSLDPVFSVRDQFAEVLRRHRFKGDANVAISDVLDSVRLDRSILDMYPHEMSGGMRQRVVLAMALVLRPDLVIADEPTTALDVLVQAHIINLLKEMKEGGTTLILITHDLAVLSELADYVGVMYAGQMVEFGEADQIYRSPKHPYTRGLLASVPTLRGKRPAFIPGAPPDLSSPGACCRFAARCSERFGMCDEDPPNFGAGSGFAKCWLYR